MPLYECKECNFITDIKTHHERHVKTNKHHRNLGKNPLEKSIPKVSFKYHLSIPKTSKESILYECDNCDACFKHINNKYRHQKYNCRQRKYKKMQNKGIKLNLKIGTKQLRIYLVNLMLR